MGKNAVATLFLYALSAMLSPALAGQEKDKPILIVHCTESGKSGDTSYQTRGEAILRLCTRWEGPIGGMASTELYKLRRSVKGLKVGERLQFYASEMSGSGTDSDGNVANMVSTGDGLTKTTVKGRHTDYAYETKPHTSPASTYSNAEILRTANGAVLHLKDMYGPNTGGEGYFYGVCIANAELNKEQRANLLTFQIGEAELDQWENLNKSQSGSARGPGGQGSWEYSVVVTARVPDLGEVAVEIEGYDIWKPEADTDDETKAGNEIRVRAWVHKTGDPKTPINQTATFTFELTKVGREKGMCANWPTQPGTSGIGPDLRILEDKNPELEQINLFEEAKTRQRVKEVKLVLSSFDYGAWGILKVKAEDKDGKPIKVVYLQRKESSEISIPKDEDHNHIADAWQEEKGAMGLPADWDEAEVKGQNARGDGLTLYQKYRGVVVQTVSGHRHVRLEPKEKAHFVIDPAEVFDPDRWKQAAGIRAYLLTNAMVDGDRRVDRYGSYARGAGKYAVRLEVLSGTVEPDPLPGQNGQPSSGDDPTQYAYTYGNTPKSTTRCRIFKDRIRGMIDRVAAAMQRALLDPKTDADREELDFLNHLGVPKADILGRLAALDGDARNGLVDKMVALAAIHEMGHACGVNGHLNSAGQEDGNIQRDAKCPMQYLDRKGRRMFVLFGELGGEGPFCKTPPDNCWSQLNVKG